MSDATAGGQANNAMIRVEENGVQITRVPRADPEVWMLMGTLASALEDVLDAAGDDIDAPYARMALDAYRAMKGQTDQRPLEATRPPERDVSQDEQ